MFNLVYQPIVQVKAQQVMGYEALLRHPEHRSPLEAIEEARRQGALVLMEAAILEKAARDISATNARLWWNVTWDNFSNPVFIGRALKRLGDVGMPPSRVVVELSERSLVEQDAFAEALERWVYDGFSVALDDFGTGGSNQNLLFGPIRPHAVKFDRSLCSGASGDGDRGRYLIAQIKEVWKLGVDVVVEGIETREDLAFFRALSVPVMVQGFVFGYPAMFSVLENKKKEWLKVVAGR
jgi:EAL domain-containing protein (putative c-di-GMP-specific phosphodiesterase class I)